MSHKLVSLYIGEGEYYTRTDADNLIAEKDREITELEESHKMEVEQLLMEIVKLKADYKEACDRLQTANLIKDEQLAATRHQKYKRCLAMAYVEWLKQMSLWNYPDSILYRRAVRREHKWRELAEKFKEAK